MPPSGSAAPSAGQARVAPVTVIVGDEELLVERAVRGIAAGVAGLAGPEAGAGAADGAGPAVHDVRAAELKPGDLSSLTAPSLFGGGAVVVVRSVQDAGKDMAAELARYAAAAAQDVMLVLTHTGGARNKSLLASLAGDGARRIDCPPVRRFGERLDFLRGEFRRAGRKADEGGLRALLDAVGTDLRELAAACSQLAADTDGPITQAVVARYYRGRAEATGFTVADRAIEGKLGDALEQLRWALATGVSPVLITSALAQGVRALGRVGAAGRGRSADALATELGMPAWKIDRVRQQLRGWTAEGVARAHSVVAETDAQVKGEGASPGYALELAITEIVACRSGR
ncbi:MAG TPA: DNA polymerase III subunit delta [Streptosporangiaceae bacterium]|nr:DNA polymerase III subunit delta [Streptosporangiaceae bacterium]